MARFRRMLDNWRSVPEKKQSAAGALLGRSAALWLGFGGPNWSARSHEVLVREGFRKNVIAHRSVKLIAECAASVPFILHRGDARIDRHPLLDLIAGPNPFQGGKEFFEAAYAHLQLSGNSYVEAVEKADGLPGELYILRPDRMKIVPGPKGWPARYDFTVGGQTVAFPVDGVSGVSPILHLKTFHPTDDYYGLSPLEAAACSIDIHNAAAGWNKALLDNAARPSGALVFEPRDGAPGSLTETQFERLKEEMETHYQGAENAGRPFLLEGGLKWQQIAFSPADMEFIQSKHVAAREIALAFGVPPMLLGIPGDNTFANYQEANRALWRLTLLPLIDKTVAALNNWLAPKFGADLRLDVDRDAIPALSVEREALWNRIGTAPFLTPNEKRRMVGLDAVAGGDELPSNDFGPFAGMPRILKKKTLSDLTRKGAVEDRQARFEELSRLQRGLEELAEQQGITFRRIWRIVKDGKTRDSHQRADGQEVDMDEPFRVDGEDLFLPSDPEGRPGNTFNCRCFVEYVEVGTDTDDDSDGGSRSIPVVDALGRLKKNHDIDLKDTYFDLTPERKRELYGRKLTDTEQVALFDNIGSELAAIEQRGKVRDKSWTLSGVDGSKIASREPAGDTIFGRAVGVRALSGTEFFSIVSVKAEIDEETVNGLRAKRSRFVKPFSAYGTEKDRSPEAARNYIIRHEYGHVLTTNIARDAFRSHAGAGAKRLVSQFAGSSLDDLIAEAFAWYTSPDYPGNQEPLPAELERELDGMLK